MAVELYCSSLFNIISTISRLSSFVDVSTYWRFVNLPERSISSSGSASISNRATLLVRFVAMKVSSSRTLVDFLENLSFVDSLLSSGGKMCPSGPPGSPVRSFHRFHLLNNVRTCISFQIKSINHDACKFYKVHQLPESKLFKYRH